jgi:DNA-binding MarR family transcriptional regulator
MSTDPVDGSGPSVDDAIRTLLLFMPRMVGRVKRIRIPDDLQSFSLAPRHLSLLAYLLFEGEMGVNELAARLEVAPATVSLMVGELSRKGILKRREDDADRRRTLVSIAEDHRKAIDGWLGRGAVAWRNALEPLTSAQRQMFIDTLAAYDREIGGE